MGRIYVAKFELFVWHLKHNFDVEWFQTLVLLQSVTGTENIYLGPHGAPPQYGRGQDTSTTANRKQRLKQKLKDAEKKTSTPARENKVEVLQDLMGSKPGGGHNPRGTESEWLDPYCHESHFERATNRGWPASVGKSYICRVFHVQLLLYIVGVEYYYWDFLLRPGS